jgi:hypothetical protein
MFPFSFEGAWDAGHFLFFGGMWYTIVILGAGMTWCIVKSIADTLGGHGEGHGHGHH